MVLITSNVKQPSRSDLRLEVGRSQIIIFACSNGFFSAAIQRDKLALTLFRCVVHVTQVKEVERLTEHFSNIRSLICEAWQFALEY